MNKVYEIIRKNFDTRMDAMVLTYLMSKGIDFCASITEKDIAEINGNDLMTAEFVQEMVRTACIIARECNLFDDIFPYIAERFGKEEEEE